MSEQTRKVHVAKQLTGPDDVIDTEEIEEFDPDILIKAAVAEFGGEPGENISVKIYAIDEGKYEWCFACTPSDLPVNERIRTEFGGGAYEARLYSGAKVRRRLPFRIREMLKQPDAPVTAPTNDVAAVVQGISKLGEMIVNMSQGFSQQIASLQGQNAAAPGPVIDPLAMQASLISNLIAMKGLLGGNEGGGAKELIEVFKSGIEVAKEVAGDGGSDDMLSFLSKGTDMITKIASAAAANPAMPTMPPAEPVQTGDPGSAGVPALATREAQAMALKHEIARLVERAKAGSSPALYADLILDRLPLPAIQSFLADGNALEKMARIDPGVMNHQQWFTELGNELRAALKEGDDGGNTPDGETVNDTDGQTGEDAPTDDSVVESADGDTPINPEGSSGG